MLDAVATIAVSILIAPPYALGFTAALGLRALRAVGRVVVAGFQDGWSS